MASTLPDLQQTETVIIEMTNAFRAENRLALVAPNAALHTAAQAYADYLARTGTFAHTADGRQPSECALVAGYRYCIVAENLALNQSNRGFETRDLAARMIEGWKNSPPHREAMLQPFVTEIGVGIAQAPEADPKFLTVQLFGRPESFKYLIHIENRAGTAVTYVLGERPNSIPDRTHVQHTACVPQGITFDIGKVTARFDASDGGAFVITTGPDGRPHVAYQPTGSKPLAVVAKAPRAPRPIKPAQP